MKNVIPKKNNGKNSYDLIIASQPYRSRIPAHKKYNYKYCYKKKNCAFGKEICYGTHWTDKYKTLPNKWPPDIIYPNFFTENNNKFYENASSLLQ